MNIQPYSKEIVKFIGPAEFFSLLHEQSLRSFIGEKLNIWADEALEKRIEELEALEMRGFVFVGEKNWLVNFIRNERSDSLNTYDKWVSENFINFLRLNFERDENYTSGMDNTWKAVLPSSQYRFNFDRLKNPAYHQIEELELYVGGNNLAPSPMHLCSLLNALSILEYSIFTFNHDAQGYEPLDITGVDVSNIIDPHRILINVISEYGSEFDRTVVLGRAWRE